MVRHHLGDHAVIEETWMWSSSVHRDRPKGLLRDTTENVNQSSTRGPDTPNRHQQYVCMYVCPSRPMPTVPLIEFGWMTGSGDLYKLHFRSPSNQPVPNGHALRTGTKLVIQKGKPEDLGLQVTNRSSDSVLVIRQWILQYHLPDGRFSISLIDFIAS